MKVRVSFTVDIDYDAFCYKYGLEPLDRRSKEGIRDSVKSDCEEFARNHYEDVLQVAIKPTIQQVDESQYKNWKEMADLRHERDQQASLDKKWDKPSPPKSRSNLDHLEPKELYS